MYFSSTERDCHGRMVVVNSLLSQQQAQTGLHVTGQTEQHKLQQ
jgi:hypothetical protein